ncbi:hypothetical protein SERLADRAFT_436158 [Serpula lacrymans var. lacrymans S7.9]|uniref:tripeptidyl-peptidase II n=1 Tax=Serpula lacrymans var. lacrymans (strain S7.9) TaxID=578457 RepID=F8NRY5_SERL9|nr:uncharacterized protein SERLADRAFT_436158 [Serpula lacrymans var. lacrymans S7.9]EGO26347.1 hypothetical protein SERLADRAFT_436158 [Serpula lacrymans var. lacrymans S7.9]
MRPLLLPLVSLALAVLPVTFGDPVPLPYVLHEKRSSAPYGWSRARKLSSTAIIPLRFAIAQSNIDKMDEYLYDVSVPMSPNYGNHWTAAEVAAKFAPSHDSIDTIHSWLMHSGIQPERIKLTQSKGWIKVDATVEEAESLLQADFRVYTHETGKEHVACESYRLPAHIAPHVDFVIPTVNFDANLAKPSDTTSDPTLYELPDDGNGPKIVGTVDPIVGLAGELKDCDKKITPACLRALYDIHYEPVSTSKNSYGIMEYTPETYVQSDMDLFAKTYISGVDHFTPNVVSIERNVNQTQHKGFPHVEANLDLQYGMTLVTSKQKVTIYQLETGASINDFFDAVDGFFCTSKGADPDILARDATYPDPGPSEYRKLRNCGTVKPANVISTSYGLSEAHISLRTAARQCAEYGKLGLMGVTVLYSSGDNGVAGVGKACLLATGSPTSSGKVFNPTFPSTCPYITSVGATQIDHDSSVFEPESACERVIYSSGGFSNYFAMPEYQKDAVQRYLKNYPPSYPASIWNSTGKSRAFPDLSANGANYVVAIDGKFNLVYGTSASSPVIGAILTMINDARLAVGKKPIGFINPAIYSSAFSGAFNDITKGSNPGCGTLGFNSTPGWDPVTGLGTPNFPKLLKHWLEIA